MAVENLKVQMEFTMGGEGWSEILYHAGASPIGFAAAAAALVEERKKMLVAVAQIHHVRISAAQPGARSFRFRVSNGAGAVSASLARDVGNVTSTVGVYGELGAYRKLQFHGRPDDAHVYMASGAINAALTGATTAYLNYLVANNYQIRHQTVAANDPVNKSIQDITVDDGVVTFVVDTTGLSERDKIRVSGVKGFNARQFNGVWTIGSKVVGPPTAFTSATTRLIDPNYFYLARSGVIRLANPSAFSYQRITGYDAFEDYSTRKTGRPSNSPRGRRSTR